MRDIRMFDYLRQYHDIEEEVLSAVVNVLQSGQLVLGEQVKAFEKGFSKYLEKGETVAVNSGTDALLIVLMALGVGEGDEVITVSNTAVPTVSAIRMAGAQPVFCDVDYDTALMDLEILDACITRKTKAIIPVHLFGNVVDIGKIKKIVEGRSIYVVEDCAQAHGATIDNEKVGMLGDASAFSFYPTKNLGAYGDAGACCSADLSLVAEMKKIRMYGFHRNYYSEREGVNSRMDEIQAAMLNVKLPLLDSYIRKRRRLAVEYDRCLGSEIGRFCIKEGVNHAYHLYVVRVPERDKVREKLQQQGINTGVHYPFPVHLMRGYEFLGYKKNMLPRTEKLAQEMISLPLYPELDVSEVRIICDCLNTILL